MDEDFEAALEWQEWQDSLCSGCRFPRSVSFDQDADVAYEGVALRCFACEAREKQASRWRDDENSRSEGVYFVVQEAD